MTLESLRARFEAKYTRGEPDECWEWQGCRSPLGYGKLSARVNGKREQLAPRVAYILAKGEIPPDAFVCHSCDNPPCVNPGHLWLGTQSDNMRDMENKRRHPRPRLVGERNGMARFSDADVANMAERYANGETQSAIANRYGTRQQVISKILRTRALQRP